MLSRRLYFSLKPYLPWRVRMAARRFLARRLRVAHAATWPIDPAAGERPAGWPGWPDNRSFAFVVTHDVENREGLAKSRQLAELEQQEGFRSSFNFIPEGPYAVPAELRAWMVQQGFEVGVHDLQHDGHLFSSADEFRVKADRINHYLREWNASGFRAGFMLRNLEWYHQLAIDYDASTFDTDPFEPQPDGQRTIFPFWIPAPAPAGGAAPAAERGYVELPYSLPQDSTLFLVLQEKTPRIWLEKLDWVAAHGGMALVNVHPDYLCFDGEKSSASTFPVRFYRELLQYVRARYEGRYWHATPREVAQFFRKTGLKNSRS